MEHWRKEAERQRHAAASARAPETARHIKALQDSKLEADAALMQKDRQLLTVRPAAAGGLLRDAVLGGCVQQLLCGAAHTRVMQAR